MPSALLTATRHRFSRDLGTPGMRGRKGKDRGRGVNTVSPHHLRPEAGGDGRQDTPVLAASIPISESWLG